MNLGIVGVIAVGVGTSTVSWWAGSRMARLDARLDSDTIRARANWASDVACTAGLGLTSVLTFILGLDDGKDRPIQMIVAAACFVLSGGFLYRLCRAPRYLMNGYPESLHPRLRHVLRHREVLVPGVVLSILGHAALMVAGLS